LRYLKKYFFDKNFKDNSPEVIKNKIAEVKKRLRGEFESTRKNGGFVKYLGKEEQVLKENA